MENKLGDFLQTYRKEHNLSLRDFAEKSGISHSYLNRLENGYDVRSGKPVTPTVEILQQIARSLNMDLGKILEISGYIVGATYVDSDGSVSTDYFPPKNNQTSSFQFNEDADIRRIERARQNMNQKEKDKMMRILEASFEDYFGDDYVDDDND